MNQNQSQQQNLKQQLLQIKKQSQKDDSSVSTQFGQQSTQSTDLTTSSVVSLKQVIGNQLLEHLDLEAFKVHPCKLSIQHNHKQCYYFHNAKDRRRQLFLYHLIFFNTSRGGNMYSSELCSYIESSKVCPFGDTCARAHNSVEQLYKFDKYKTKFCTYYPFSLAQCDYGNYCSFAHSEEDIKIELIHNLEFDQDFFIFYYKTEWCPYNLTQHDKALCVYAHNWQDFRRKLGTYQYAATPCQNWDSKNFIIEYELGCPEGFGCSKCHGWKELEFHQYNYRTKECPTKQKCRRIDCPYFHKKIEQRNLPDKILGNIFKLVPRNRITRREFNSQNLDYFLLDGTNLFAEQKQQYLIKQNQLKMKKLYLKEYRKQEKQKKGKKETETENTQSKQ